MLRMVVVGLGGMGRRHVVALRSMPDEFEVVGVCDLREEAREVGQREFSLNTDLVFSSFDDMLQATQPDGVVVATTADTHAQFTRQAAAAGVRYVLCEKPMATSVSDCLDMIAACERSGTHLAINHQRRYLPESVEVRPLVDSAEIGGLQSMSVMAGNMGLAMVGSHYIEMFTHWTGETPEIAIARFSASPLPNPRGKQFFDASGFILLETPSGRRLTIEAPPEHSHGLTVIYSGKLGQVIVDELVLSAKMVFRTEANRALPSTRYYSEPLSRMVQLKEGDVVTATCALWRDFVRGKSVPTGYDGANVVRMLAAAYESNDNDGAPVYPARLSNPTRRFAWP